MSIAETKTIEGRRKATQAIAAGGLAAGLMASSCCLLPLLLFSVGIGGTWISRLTALAPYQPLFLSAAAVSLGLGFWRAYRRQECAVGTLCEKPGVPLITKGLLWFGAAAVLVAIGVDVIAPLIV